MQTLEDIYQTCEEHAKAKAPRGITANTIAAINIMEEVGFRLQCEREAKRAKGED